MADIVFKVDTALAEVPVNIFPLTDDTDFKTREVSIAYNAAGMDLVWNFVDTDGAMIQTAVTPTTSGAYDWAHIGDGMYTIEIPASGGASINNDTEGFGWFTGMATGVLPWRSPVYQFSPALVVNSLINGSDALQVDTIQLSGDTTAANNAESFFDGTGYAGTNNVIPTVTTLTGHTAQTGDTYAIVNNGTYGNAALETLVDDIESYLTNVTYGLNALLTAINSRLATTGYTAPPTVSQIADAVCDEALSGHSAPGTVGISITDTLGYVTALRSALTDLRAAALDRIVGTLATGTHTAQTGDAYAIVNNGTYGNSALETIVDDLESRLTAARAGYLDNLSAGAVALASGVVVTTNNDKTGYALTGTDIADIKAVTTKVDTALSLDGAVYQFTANALELAPSGGSGGDATAANQLLIIGHLEDVKGATFSESTDSLEAIRDRGDAAWTTGGGMSGSSTITINVKDGSAVNIVGAWIEVWDSAGTSFIDKKQSNPSGNAVYNGDDGTYTIKMYKTGYSFTNQTLVVSGNTTANYIGTAFIITPPSDPTLCRVYTKLSGIDNVYPSSATGTATIKRLPYDTGSIFVSSTVNGVYAPATGIMYWDLIQGANVQIMVGLFGIDASITVPAENTQLLNDLI